MMSERKTIISAGSKGIWSLLFAVWINPWLSGQAMGQGTLQEIDALLRQADQALHGSSSGQKVESEKERDREKYSPGQRKKTNGDSSSRKASLAIEPTQDNIAPVTETTLQGVSHQKFFQFDLKQTPSMPSSPDTKEVRLGYGVNQIGGRYSLKKDDDNFSPLASSLINGLTVHYQHSQSVPWLAPAYRGQVLGAMGGGIFHGDMDVERTGIQNGVDTLTYTLIPMDAVMGLGFWFWQVYRVEILVGVGMELIYQRGAGEYDTASENFWGDIGGVGIHRDVLSGVSVNLRYQRRGIGILSTKRPMDGNLFVLGLAYSLSG